MGNLQILFPASQLNPKAVDEVFQEEFLAAKRLGLKLNVVLFNESALIEDDPWASIYSHNLCTRKTVYRGWMLSKNVYALLHKNLLDRGVEMLTSPEQYWAAHHSSGWERQFREFLPKTIHSDTKTEDFLPVINEFSGQVFVKDGIKSSMDSSLRLLETSWSDQEKISLIERFIDDRGDLFSGNLTFQEFVEFTEYEVRTWWLNGHVANFSYRGVTPPEDFNFSIREVPDSLLEKCETFPNKFFTADFGLDSSGVWRLVELGDGQVSGLDRGSDLEHFYESLASQFTP